MAHLNLDTALVERCRDTRRKNLEARGADDSGSHDRCDRAVGPATARRRGSRPRSGGAVVPRGQHHRRGSSQGGRRFRDGVLVPFVNGMIQKKMTPTELARAVAARKINLMKLPKGRSVKQSMRRHESFARPLSVNLLQRREKRDALRAKTKDPFDASGKERPASLRDRRYGKYLRRRDSGQGRGSGRGGRDRGHPQYRAVAAGLCSAWRDDRGLRRDLCHSGKFPNHARGARRGKPAGSGVIFGSRTIAQGSACRRSRRWRRSSGSTSC